MAKAKPAAPEATAEPVEPTTEPAAPEATTPPVVTDTGDTTPPAKQPKAEVPSGPVKSLHWTISLPDTTLPTRTVQVGNEPCTAEAALAKYLDLVGIFKLPKEPVVVPVEITAS